MFHRFVKSSITLLVLFLLTISSVATAAAATSRPMPDASNTGVHDGVDLERYTGTLDVTTDGALVEGLYIDGNIRIMADDVTVRDVVVEYGGTRWAIETLSGNTGTVVEYSEIRMTSSRGANAGVNQGGENTIVRHTEISGHGDGIKAATGGTYEYNWIHLAKPEGSDIHLDAIQNGRSNLTIRGNVLWVPKSDRGNAAYINTTFATTPPSNLLIEDNWIAGGNYALFLEPTKNGDCMADVTVANNRFAETHRWGRIYTKGCQIDEYGSTLWNPDETTPVDTTPVDTTPVDTTPEDTIPVDVAVAVSDVGFTVSPANPTTGQQVTLTGTATGDVASWVWDDAHGDYGKWSLGNGQSITFTFNTAGTKLPRLVVKGTDGSTAEAVQELVVSDAAAPVSDVDFTVSPANPTTGQQVTLTGTATGDVASWVWDDAHGDYGKWSLGNGQSITFTFNTAGTKLPRLVVKGTDGSTAEAVQELVVSDAAAPVSDVDFTVSPANPTTGQQVTLTGTATGDVASWVWDDAHGDYGKWSLGNGQSITFTFNKPGTKLPRLVVTGTDGSTAEAVRDLVVTRRVR